MMSSLILAPACLMAFAIGYKIGSWQYKRLADEAMGALEESNRYGHEVVRQLRELNEALNSRQGAENE